jgi:hypothetical protein
MTVSSLITPTKGMGFVPTVNLMSCIVLRRWGDNGSDRARLRPTSRLFQIRAAVNPVVNESAQADTTRAPKMMKLAILSV